MAPSKSKGKGGKLQKFTRWRKQMKEGDRIMENPDPSDLVIPLMGPTGVGKSSFINAYFGEEGSRKAEVGHDLESCTRHLDWFTTTLGEDSCYPGRRLVLVDTPGFDDTYADDSEILRRIGIWLAASYVGGMSLAGVIYLHDINQKRMFGSTRMNLSMFERLVGPKAFPTVALVTNQWDTVKLSIGEEREAELKDSFWENAIKDGATIMRVNTDSPHKTVIENILRRHLKVGAEGRVMLIQKELVDKEKIIPMTKAGQQLRYSLEQLLEFQKQLAQNVDDDERRNEITQKIGDTQRQVQGLSPNLKAKISAWARSLLK